MVAAAAAYNHACVLTVGVKLPHTRSRYRASPRSRASSGMYATRVHNGITHDIPRLGAGSVGLAMIMRTSYMHLGAL